MSSFSNQLDDARRNRDDHRLAREGAAEEQVRLRKAIRRELELAEEHYQEAAAMHFERKVSYYGGRIDALKEVLKLIV
jgi:hypothetical protein